jgi:hypothetical protein
VSITKTEREIMEHASAWPKCYRNHYVTGEGSDSWPTIQALCASGLMRMSRAPSELSGGDPVFMVTKEGFRELSGHPEPESARTIRALEAQIRSLKETS